MYLIYFSNTYHDFRLPELDSILELFGYDYNSIYDKSAYSSENPFLLASFPDDECVRKVTSRAVLIKSVYNLWCEGDSWEELFQAIQNLLNSFTQPYYDISQSWRFDIVSFNRSLNPEEQESFRLLFEPYLPFEGLVRMKDPMNRFACIMHFVPLTKVIGHLYLGTLVSDGQRNINDRFDLKKRHYIGPTSTCAELSFLMSNQIQTMTGSLIWDCFVGTGSLLVAATAHGGICMGSDIDLRILTGLKKGKKAGSIRQNFDQYCLRYPDLVRMDLSSLPIRFLPIFDGITCDPPYGIRAGARRTKQKSDDLTSMNTHNANTEIYNPDNVIIDLLDLAAKVLVLGGKICYLFPTLGNHTNEEVPRHPCLELISNSEDKLTLLISRRLITMKKICEYDSTRTAEYKDAVQSSIIAQNLSYSDLMETTVENNRSEGKTRSQRRERQIENENKWRNNDLRFMDMNKLLLKRLESLEKRKEMLNDMKVNDGIQNVESSKKEKKKRVRIEVNDNMRRKSRRLQGQVPELDLEMAYLALEQSYTEQPPDQVKILRDYVDLDLSGLEIPIHVDGSFHGPLNPTVAERYGIGLNGVKQNVEIDEEEQIELVTPKKSRSRTNGTSSAKERSKMSLKTNPNTYFYRHVEPNGQYWTGDWTKEEIRLFCITAQQYGCGDKWGLFASYIPHRVGYQCSNFYRQYILPKRLVIDPKYTINSNDEAIYKYNKHKLYLSLNQINRIKHIPILLIISFLQLFI